MRTGKDNIMNDEMKKVAVLIDAENISYKYAQLILNEAGNIGNVVCRRIYGDWSSGAVSSWKTPIMEYSITAIQQFQNTAGKNSSDSALIIDAMDLLHEGKYQCVCIVSSDSDFTRLASRLREGELYVVGMGEQKTPSSFRSACDKFLYLDVLFAQNEEEEKAQEKTDSEAIDEKKTKPGDGSLSGLNLKAVVATIDEIMDTESDEDGWATLAAVGNRLNRKITDFDVRNFQCRKLSDFITKLGVYEVKGKMSSANPDSKVIYVKKKAQDG